MISKPKAKRITREGQERSRRVQDINLFKQKGYKTSSEAVMCDLGKCKHFHRINCPDVVSLAYIK